MTQDVQYSLFYNRCDIWHKMCNIGVVYFTIDTIYDTGTAVLYSVVVRHTQEFGNKYVKLILGII